jgi:hypothetical protein
MKCKGKDITLTDAQMNNMKVCAEAQGAPSPDKLSMDKIGVKTHLKKITILSIDVNILIIRFKVFQQMCNGKERFSKLICLMKAFDTRKILIKLEIINSMNNNVLLG